MHLVASSPWTSKSTDLHEVGSRCIAPSSCFCLSDRQLRSLDLIMLFMFAPAPKYSYIMHASNSQLPRRSPSHSFAERRSLWAGTRLRVRVCVSESERADLVCLRSLSKGTCNSCVLGCPVFDLFVRPKQWKCVFALTKNTKNKNCPHHFFFPFFSFLTNNQPTTRAHQDGRTATTEHHP